MKYFTVILTVILLPISVCSCFNGYRSDLSCAELGEAISAAVPLDSGYFCQNVGYLGYYFPDFSGDAALFKASSNSSENEFGILRSDRTGETRTLCERYIERQRAEYLSAKGTYTPEEYEKYKNAAVFTCGNYVIYTIMTPEDSEKALTAVRNMLSN